MTRSSFFALLTGLVAITLTGCSTAAQPSPDEVITEVSQQLAAVSNANYHLDLYLTGTIPSSLGNLDSAKVKLSGAIIGQNNSLPDYSVLADVTGTTNGASIHLGGQIINTTDYTYFQLTDLSLPSLLPVALDADKKWYKVKNIGSDETVSPANIDSQLTTSELGVIGDLIGNSHPLEVTEVLPVTTVGGIRAFHYKTHINPSELKTLLAGLGEVLKTKTILPDLDYLGDYQPEIFVSTRDHQLLEFKATGLYVKDNLPISFNLDLNLTNHNKATPLNPPKASENLDSAKLFNLPKLPF